MSSYNLVLIDYKFSQQIRIYNNPIKKQDDLKNSEHEKGKVEDNIDQIDISNNDIKDKEHSKYVSENRTKQKIYSIARSNSWDWFITLTFDQKEFDNSNYDLVVEYVGKWIDRVKHTYCKGLKYLLIPELHADGKHWHIHGLFADIGSLNMVDSGIKHHGMNVYNMIDWPYGFSTATRVQDCKRVSSYVTKYITKQSSERIANRKKYWSSRNLEKPTRTEMNLTADEIEQIILDNDYRITHMTTQECPPANRKIRYIELKKE